MAWVGLVEEGSVEVRVAAAHGIDRGYLDPIRVTWDDSPTGQGAAGTAIRTGRAVAVERMEDEPTYAPWREHVLRLGYRSSAALPLCSGEEVLGALTAYSADPDHFTPDRLQVLQSLANLAAIGLTRARLYEQTQRHAGELQGLLRLSEATLATIPSTVVVLDAGLNILSANRPTWEGHELTFSRTPRMNLTEVLPPALLERENLLARLRAAVDGGGRDEVLAVRHPASDHPGREHEDRYLDFRVQGFTIAEENEAQAARVLLVVDDVTRHQVLEEQLREAAKLESIGRLAGGVAHDFNNVLTGIIGHAHFLRMSVADGSQEARDLEQLVALADRAATLTRQLLAFSRRQPLQRVVISPTTLVADVVKMLRPSIGEDIELEFHPASDTGDVKVDPGQIQQVLMNLAVNARDAMPGVGRLTIETANVVLDEAYGRAHVDVKPGPYVMLAVTDDGAGMDKATLDRVFEPFFTTKEVGKGTGLGLAAVYGIVKQHGGNIWAYSEPGRGTTFKVYLPRSDVGHSALATAGEASPMPGSETILVVEDEEAVRSLVVRVLQDQGYRVYCAPDPQTAEAMLADLGDEVSLLLTDVVMPGATGQQLYQRLVAKRPSLRVLYISGYADHAAMDHGALGPGAPFLGKPFVPAMLARKVREVLDN